MSHQHINSITDTVVLTDRIQIPIPDQLADHKLIVYIGAEFASGTTPTLTTPSGWTLAPDGVVVPVSGRLLLGVYHRSATSDLSVEFVFNRDFDIAHYHLQIDDGIDSTVIDDSNKATEASTLGHTAPSITTTVNNALVQGVWLARRTSAPPFTLTRPSDMQQLVNVSGAVAAADSENLALLIAEFFQGTAGVIPTKDATSSALGEGAYYMLALKPNQSPTRPEFITPAKQGSFTSLSITSGIAYRIELLPSISPLIDQDDIQYEIDYSSTGINGTWTNITTTSAGVLAHNWSTSGLQTGNAYILRARAKDPTNTKFSGYSYTIVFSIVPDLTPGVPIDLHIEQPEGTRVTVADIAADLWLKGTFNDPGDVMSAFKSNWGTTFGSYPNTSTNTTNILSKLYPASTFSAGTVFFQVQTADNAATYGPFGNLTLPVGSKPATPNITTTTITTARPLLQFTSGGHFAFRWLVKIGGVTQHDSGIVPSSGTSYTLDYDFRNGDNVVLHLSVYSNIELPSAEDTQAITVSYTPPATPTTLATAIHASGHHLIEGANSDTPDSMTLVRFVSGLESTTTVEIARGLTPDPVFQDYNAEAGKAYKYYYRAVDGTLISESADSSAVTLLLPDLWIHLPIRNGISSNVKPSPTGLPAVLNLFAQGPFRRLDDVPHHVFNLRGREFPLTTYGSAVGARVEWSCIIELTEDWKIDRLLEIFKDRGVVRLRGAGEPGIFAHLDDTRDEISSPGQKYYRVPIRATQTYFEEDLRNRFIA